ncbi:MAG: hypothetical protein JSV62_14455 [Promethearchaeota archaeon]|nr:MAG: hypothetical protein JSV62_14455 [Candidatus Lokiarchaeota archaeon]
MNRSRLVKVSILLMVAIVFLGCVASANAFGQRPKVRYRPLSDYTKNNPSVFYWWVGPAPTYDFILDLMGDGNPPSEGTYNGFIKERELPDGRAEVTVYLTAHGIPFWLWVRGEGNLAMEGKMLWYFEIEKFIIEEPGAEIPSILTIPYPDDWLVISGCGMGHGTFTEFAEDFGYTPGADGMFFMFQYCYVEDGIAYWPYEIHDMWEL